MGRYRGTYPLGVGSRRALVSALEISHDSDCAEAFGLSGDALREWNRTVDPDGDVPLEDRYAHSAAFVIGPDGEPVGTAFRIRVTYGEGMGHYYEYWVTAHHVVKNLSSSSIRIQTKEPDAQPREFGKPYPVQIERWYPHEDERVDVAVAPITGPKLPGGLMWATTAIPIHLKAWMNEREPLSMGGPVHFVGLFEVSRETKRFVSMVRSGTIGAWNERDIPLWTTEGDRPKVDGHLIDARSYAGFSGSPCFMLPADWLMDYGTSGHKMKLQIPKRETELIGVILGSMDGREVLIHEETGDPAPGPYRSSVNLGVAVVAPVERIIETLTRNDLVADREKQLKDRKEKRKRIKRGLNLDSAEEEGITRDEFLEALDKATDPLKPSDEEPVRHREKGAPSMR